MDDGTVHEEIGKALKEFLPATFPSLFEKSAEPSWECVSRSELCLGRGAWLNATRRRGIMGYTASGDTFVREPG